MPRGRFTPGDFTPGDRTWQHREDRSPTGREGVDTPRNTDGKLMALIAVLAPLSVVFGLEELWPAFVAASA
ncbi:hypothetical protein FHR84_003502 [Actinopolyspora biskrensis]|uniref:Uncharacterized protein n=1 Tax=Actinopolyspora biskrensis TaxID=1470178 RepID=A0A852ZDT6_9ACTN|nr:hypothetical protein [Actinopolyspora biskrensis]NYH80153.1 hypothetical protein [Actinopolyspora biskrensis]